MSGPLARPPREHARRAGSRPRRNPARRARARVKKKHGNARRNPAAPALPDWSPQTSHHHPTDGPHTKRPFPPFLYFFPPKKRSPKCARDARRPRKKCIENGRVNISARRWRRAARARSTHSPAVPCLGPPRATPSFISLAAVMGDAAQLASTPTKCRARPCRPPPEGDLDLRHRVDQITPRKVRRGSSCVPPRIRERRRTRHGFRLRYM